MAASKCCRSAGWFGLVLLGLPAPAHAEPSSRAELTSLLGSGELLGSGSRAAEEAPWQSLASPRRADENRARLAVASTDVGFLPGVTTSALLSVELRLNAGTSSPVSLRDVSSSLGLSWQLTRSTQVSLRAFPFDTDYLRLGYLHALDWGGTDVTRGESIFLTQTGAAPGLQLGLQTPRIRLFSAIKSATINDALRGPRRLWGTLSGGSVDLSPGLRADAGFGYFQRPTLPLGRTLAPSFVEGASLRLVWHRGPAEPELAAEPFRPPALRDDASRFDAEATPGAAVALEGVTLVQRLRRFENPSVAALAPAPAAALYGSVRGRRLAAHAAVAWRSLAFVLRNDARLAGGETLPAAAVAQSEISAWLGGSCVLPLRLVPSAEIGVRLPAALQTPSALPGYGQTLIAGGPAGFEALPIGAARLPVVAARLGLRLQASPSLSLMLFSDYQRNPNRVGFTPSRTAVTRRFATPDSLATFSAVQARF